MSASQKPLPVISQDEATGKSAWTTEYREHVSAQTTRLGGGYIQVAGGLAEWFVDESGGGGSIVTGAGVTVISTGVLVGGLGKIRTRHVARLSIASENNAAMAIKLNLLAAGGRYRFGVFTDLNGYFFEIDGAAVQPTLYSRKAGVDTPVSVFTGGHPFAVDLLPHVYAIRYLGIGARFYQGQSNGVDDPIDLKHTMYGITQLVDEPDFPLRIEVENLSAPGSDFSATVAQMFLRRIGPMLDAQGSTITRPATSTVNAVIAASNPMRRRVTIVNDSTHLLYLKYGLVASSTSFTEVLGPGAKLTVDGNEYSGQIDGALNAGTGFAQVTETAEV